MIYPNIIQIAENILYSDGKKYIGKMLSVRYQEMTDSNVPRFPVGIAIRDYE